MVFSAEQKIQAADFLDMAEDYTRSGYYKGKRAYQVSAPGVDSSDCGAGSAESAEAADSLDAIAVQVCACNGCRLAAGRKNAVPGEGVEQPLVLVVGEGPGAEEDAQGRPFVGAAGQLLDKMLSAIGLSRETNCFIANVVKCRPPGNRDPETDEKAACRPFLLRQIRLLCPQIIVAAGRIAAQTLLETDEGITQLRGRWQELPLAGGKVLVLPVFHPSYLLRAESQKPLAWEDMKKLSRRLATLDATYDVQTAALRKKYKI